MSFLFEISNLHFEYPLGKQKVVALSNIQSSIESGKITCLTGPSGSGKSTLLNVLGLIEPIQKGEVIFNGRNFSHLSELERNHLRRFEFGFVFQSFQLFPVLNAQENVEYFLIKQRLSGEKRRHAVHDALKKVGLWDHRHKKPLEMSGGQQQRVAIARVIAKNPRVIIADEPTANLDQKTGRQIMQILKDLNQNDGVSILVSSHDPMVHEYASSQIKLQDGKLL